MILHVGAENTGPLKEQQTFLTIELSLQTPEEFSFVNKMVRQIYDVPCLDLG